MTDRPTDRQMDRAGHIVACTRLEICVSPGDGLVQYWTYKQAKTGQPGARPTPLFKTGSFEKSSPATASSKSDLNAGINNHHLMDFFVRQNSLTGVENLSLISDSGCTAGKYDRCEPRKKNFT